MKSNPMKFQKIKDINKLHVKLGHPLETSNYGKGFGSSNNQCFQSISKLCFGKSLKGWNKQGTCGEIKNQRQKIFY